jgi:hypothetical protein
MGGDDRISGLRGNGQSEHLHQPDHATTMPTRATRTRGSTTIHCNTPVGSLDLT